MILTVFVVLLLIDLLVFTQADRYILSFFMFVGTLIGAYFFIPEVNEYVTSQGMLTFLLHAAPTYIGIGVAVAAGKWVLFNFQVARTVKQYASSFVLNSNHRDENQYTQFLRYVETEHSLRRLLKHDYHISYNVDTKEEMIQTLTPVSSKYVARIAFWIGQWPVVIVALLVEDILLKFSEFVSGIFGAMFTRMSRYLIVNATKGLFEQPTTSTFDASAK